MRDGTGKTTSEDRATQLLIWETLSLANTSSSFWGSIVTTSGYFVGSSPSFWFCHLSLLSYFLDALHLLLLFFVLTCHYSCEVSSLPTRLQVLSKLLVQKLNCWENNFHVYDFVFLSYVSLSWYVYLVRSLSSVWVWCPCSCVRTSSPGWGGNSGAGRAPDLGKIKTYYPDNTHTGCFFHWYPP